LDCNESWSPAPAGAALPGTLGDCTAAGKRQELVRLLQAWRGLQQHFTCVTVSAFTFNWGSLCAWVNSLQ